VGDGGERIDLIIIDVAAMEQKVEFTVGQMPSSPERDGFTVLQGIRSDTGEVVIRPESEALLAEVKALPEENRDLRLSVEGHNDNVGRVSSNPVLSTRRAEAVRVWLVGKGIAATRLASQGFGDARPIADNRTEAGRAVNRRVELVRQLPRGGGRRASRDGRRFAEPGNNGSGDTATGSILSSHHSS
jgi:outer membrane protein OmpA-like peptidoglycan-associated protein